MSGLASTPDYVFVVGLGTFDPKTKEQRADIIRETLLGWEFVTDVLDFDPDRRDDADTPD